MGIVRTDLGDTTTTARRVSFEPVSPFVQTNVQKAIEEIASYSVPSAAAISFASSPYTVVLTDRLLLVDTSGGAITINMMAGGARNGIPIEIKDSTGNAAANPITVTPFGAETIDGLATYLLDSAFVAVNFKPKSGGGYAVI